MEKSISQRMMEELEKSGMKKSVLQGKVEFEPMAGPDARLKGLADAFGEMQKEVNGKNPGGYVDIKIMLEHHDGRRVNASGINPYSVMPADCAVIVMTPLGKGHKPK